MNGYHCRGWRRLHWWRQQFTISFLLSALGEFIPCDPAIPCAFSGPAGWLIIDKLNCLIHKKWCSHALRWCGIINELMYLFLHFFQIHFFFLYWQYHKGGEKNYWRYFWDPGFLQRLGWIWSSFRRPKCGISVAYQWVNLCWGWVVGKLQSQRYKLVYINTFREWGEKLIMFTRELADSSKL